MLSYDLGKLSTYGQKLIVEPAGTQLSAEEARVLGALRPAGVMIRSRNFAFQLDYDRWLALYSSLIDDIRSAVGRTEIIISIDHEGGRVVRPPRPITRFPYARTFARKASHVASAMARELRSLAVNMNFAPVADIDDGASVIKDRAFSSNPAEVTECALAFYRAFQAEQILAVAKHFPGHGAACTDSHFHLPVLPHTLPQLEAHELLPFQALVSAGVPAIMTGHLLLPALDPHESATTSRALLYDLLRTKMGFQGVAIADALGMGAVAERMKGGSLTEAALHASLDLFLVTGDTVSMQDAERTALEMQKAVAAGKVTEETVVSSLARIERLLERARVFPVAQLDSTLLDEHAQLARELDPKGEWEQFQYIPKGFN